MKKKLKQELSTQNDIDVIIIAIFLFILCRRFIYFYFEILFSSLLDIFCVQWLKYCGVLPRFRMFGCLFEPKRKKKGHKFPNCTNCLDRSCLLEKLVYIRWRETCSILICLVFLFRSSPILSFSLVQFKRNRFMCSAVYSLYWSRLVKCNVDIFCIIFEQTLYMQHIWMNTSKVNSKQTKKGQIGLEKDVDNLSWHKQCCRNAIFSFILCCFSLCLPTIPKLSKVNTTSTVIYILWKR